MMAVVARQGGRCWRGAGRIGVAVCGGERWSAVECGGVRWSAVECGGVRCGGRRGGRWSAQIACNPASVPLGWLRLAACVRDCTLCIRREGLCDFIRRSAAAAARSSLSASLLVHSDLMRTVLCAFRLGPTTSMLGILCEIQALTFPRKGPFFLRGGFRHNARRGFYGRTVNLSKALKPDIFELKAAAGR
ncbi:hypothetical protein L1887_49659 [Cichorium endivia]|nr:hypothetical protein L1887_49659 [Cichorium endivia]